MDKKILIITILFLLVLIPVVFQYYSIEKQNRVCFGNYCFSVELALTDEERNRGLMFRENLDIEGGMLFVFEEEGNHPFWMKNTLIPLDIIWINNNKEVVFINENTEPCKEYFCPVIEPAKNAKYVLEINGGVSKELGLVVGDRANIEYLK